jgi:glycosyltransferase involved in cell wall biosynthesis
VVEPSVAETVQLYQTLYWLAQTAAAPTPQADLIHVTAAGWAAIPALVDRAIHGTPILLTEHGMYVRESYLASVLRDDPPGVQWINTRIARALSIAAYRAATVVSPVAFTHVPWEEFLGTKPERIRPIPNGVLLPEHQPPPLPNTKTVVMIGRFDPLKDIHTALRTAAHVIRQVPEARFLHYGPVDVMQKPYAESCRQFHEQLGLGDSFQFMGSTKDVTSVLHAADVVLSTSISEGLPIAVLEAMAQGRPVVATAVGGVRDTVNGCGLMAPPRDPHGLASAVVTLLRNPPLAQQLGTRSYHRVADRYPLSACVAAYRELLTELLDRTSVGSAHRHLRLVAS